MVRVFGFCFGIEWHFGNLSAWSFMESGFSFGISYGDYELIIVLSVSIPFHEYKDGQMRNCIEKVMVFA